MESHCPGIGYCDQHAIRCRPQHNRHTLFRETEPPQYWQGPLVQRGQRPKTREPSTGKTPNPTPPKKCHAGHGFVDDTLGPTSVDHGPRERQGHQIHQGDLNYHYSRNKCIITIKIPDISVADQSGGGGDCRHGRHTFLRPNDATTALRSCCNYPTSKQ
ncbi:MAG: hypothetical protein M2R45_00636 [Verrucomicrobia subdivision 3 bacterium]|nr:hypothetical protein [Limisphaerales bacterium]